MLRYLLFSFSMHDDAQSLGGRGDELWAQCYRRSEPSDHAMTKRRVAACGDWQLWPPRYIGISTCAPTSDICERELSENKVALYVEDLENVM